MYSPARFWRGHWLWSRRYGQPGHLDPAQSKSAQPRQHIEVDRDRRRYVLMPLGHRSAILFRNPQSALLLFYFLLSTCL
jgi:hypothetical protein